MINRRCIFSLAVAMSLCIGNFANAADNAALVEVINASTPTLCAETDNIALNFVSPTVRRFTIEAVHPAYMGTIVADRSDPDFRNCDMPHTSTQPFTPRRITLYETEEWQLIGYTFPNFWRSSPVTVQVGDHIETGLHLVQLWKRFQQRAEEILVIYPQDGYWRARPLPPPHLRWSAYGSSFLIGPVETSERPFVDIKRIVFDPATQTFRLAFARGGSASVHLDDLNQDHLVLDASLDAPISDARPFAALRSMFVTEFNADVAHIAWHGDNDKGWRQSPIMNFDRAKASEVWTGRMVPSRHNTSAPDMVFRDFRSTAQ